MTKIKVTVIPGAQENQVKEDPKRYKVWVKPPAEQGQANRAVQQVLADYFNVPPCSVQLIKGGRDRNKIFEIRD